MQTVVKLCTLPCGVKNVSSITASEQEQLDVFVSAEPSVSEKIGSRGIADGIKPVAEVECEWSTKHDGYWEVRTDESCILYVPVALKRFVRL